MIDLSTNGSGQTAPAEILATEICAVLATLPAAARFLEGWPVLAATRAAAKPHRLPVVAQLDGLARFATPATAPLVQALAACADALEWRQTYTAADFGPTFLDGYGWTELIGLKGPIPSTSIACGILMLGADIDYPAHAHEAEELYVPLAGTALWTRGEQQPARQPPGQAIHHPSWMSHAMQTGSEPLLALYVWRGGPLSVKPAIVGRRSA